MLQAKKKVKEYGSFSKTDFLFQQYIENQKTPLLFVQVDPLNIPHIEYYNTAFSTTFLLNKGIEKNFQLFMEQFSFQSEPVNILASSENVKALLKKTGELFHINTQQFDNEHVIFEFIKIQNDENVHSSSSGIEYYKFADNLPEFVFELNYDFMLTYLNLKALKMLGYGETDLKKGLHIKDITLKKDFSNIIKFLYTIFEGKEVKEKTLRIIDSDGSIILLEIYFSLICHGVKVTGIRGIGIDITHRKKIEEKLIQVNQQIEEADRLKTAFLMNMSHEIRTPLNSVLGYTQLLQRRLKEPELIHYVQNIRSSGRDLLQLFNDLIDLSKIYAEQLDIIPVKVNLNKVIDKLYREFKTEIEIKNKPLDLKVVKALHDDQSHILIDDDRLKQILNSLFNNSLKFTNNGHIEFGYQMADKNIHFFIKDTGIGINKNIQSQVFEFFYRQGHILGDQNRGTGIGLAITKGIIDKMNGSIWIESDEGKGTLFNILLPYQKVNEENESLHGKKIASLQNINILIVEDDENNLFLLKSFLDKTGAIIYNANTGKDALEMIAGRTFEIIFMDINLPDANGIEITKKIRKDHKNVIIIAQSAYVNKEDKQNCYAAGCDAFIEKPIFGEVLLSTLSSFISKKSN